MSVPLGKPTFGSLLREHRLAAGLTQEALAERSGISARSVQLLEADSVRPRRSTIAELVRALSLAGPDRAELERAAAAASRERLSSASGGARAGRDRHEALSVARSQPEGGEPEHGLVALPRPSPTNVPWPVSSLLGRQADLAALRALIAEDRQRLVTLTGVGGSGKTRLGVQVAAELLSAFADGVWFAELAPTSSPEMLPQVVAGALGVREVGGAPILDTLLGFLRRKSLLLVLDNCEHLIDACAALAGRLLTACPDLHILATSREPLQIHGERRWQVRPLAVPDLSAGWSLDDLAASPSVRLFMERAQVINASFRLTDANAAAVAQVCARLDGIPLAIELAAARVGVLGVDQIAERLANDFRVLAKGTRGGPTRQQTMQAALGWSYELLTASERTAFSSLSTFAGGFDLEAAEAICPTEEIDESDILDMLERLVDKSLVVADETTRGPRYRLLEPVRQYAQQALLTSGADSSARSRHAAYFAALAALAEPMLHGPNQLVWLGRLERERDNLRAALGWLAAHGSADEGLQMAVNMAPYWQARGYLSEGRRWLQTIFAASSTDVSRATQVQALMAAGTLAYWQRDLAPAHALLSEALEAAQSLADRRSEAEALCWLSGVHRHLEEVERGLMLSEEGLRLGHELGDEAIVALALLNCGMVLSAQGEADRAISVLEESLVRNRRLGDVRHIAIAAMVLGRITTVLGRTSLLTVDHTRAAALLREAVVTLTAIGDQANLVDALGGLAHAAMAQGESRQAARRLAASRALRHALGMRYSAPNDAYDLSIREALQLQMTPSEFDEAYAAGAAMSLDEVLAEIIAER